MIRAVIFDFNGVLVDDEHLHFALFRDVLAGVGLTLTEDEYRETYLGFDDRGCFTEALRRAGRDGDPGRVERMIADKARLYLDHADAGLRYFDGGAECVERLARRWPVAICSGALRPEIDHALRRMGLDGAVSAVIAAEDVDRCKPDPEGYLLALDALRARHGEDLEAGHCLVVEDSLAGVESGKAAGMWVVGVPNSYPAEELRAAGADAVVAGLAELTPETVARLFAPEVSP
jgi:HAD superfamily hydrolase (TIGR01509 family)